MIDLNVWQDRFEQYKKMDYANNFYGFWRWKVSTETSQTHILDKMHLPITHEKLVPIMKAWLTYRPFDPDACLNHLRCSLEEIAPFYNRLRNISLLDLEKTSIDDIKFIWHKLGRAKEKNGMESASSKYFVIAVAKPLMFLWGQTLAFDDLVRGCLPALGFKGASNNRWSFYQWYNTMRRFQERTKNDTEFINLCNEVTRCEFGTEAQVPYGQFLDLYYWVGAKYQ